VECVVKFLAGIQLLAGIAMVGLWPVEG